MPTFPGSPVVFFFSGAPLTGVTPADVATFPLPISGMRYICQSPVMALIAGTGDVGSSNISYTLHSQPNGSGVQLAAISSVAAITPGMARVIASVPTGWCQATGVTLRQTASSAFTGSVVGITIPMWPIP